MMDIPYGPHQRAGRRRRRGKAAVVVTLTLLSVVFLSSPPADGPAAHPGPTPAQELTEAQLAAILRDCKISLDVAEGYGEKYPEHSEEFIASWREGWK